MTIKKLRCLNFVPLKSLNKEGLEAKLVGMKKFEVHSDLENLYIFQAERLARKAADRTTANAYRAYWRKQYDYCSTVGWQVIDIAPYTIEVGTLTIKLYRLYKKPTII